MATVTMAFNRPYLYPALVAVYSMKSWSVKVDELIVGVRDSAIGFEDLQFFKRVCSALGVSVRLEMLPDDDLLRGSQHISRDAFSKFYLGDIVQGVHLWLDSDAIFVGPMDWRELETVIGEMSIGMVSHNEMSFPATNLKLDERAEYNSGVIMWGDTKRLPWRDYARRGEELLWADQEVFNMVYRGRIVSLEGKYNRNFTICSWTGSNVIAHYPGTQKPWQVWGFAKGKCQAESCGFNSWWLAAGEMINDPKLKAFRLKLRWLSFLGVVSGMGPRVLIVNWIQALLVVSPFGLHPSWKNLHPRRHSAGKNCQ
jgi:lipopolysaccharide biosynthesis glycosyltransferase